MKFTSALPYGKIDNIYIRDNILLVEQRSHGSIAACVACANQKNSLHAYVDSAEVDDLALGVRELAQLDWVRPTPHAVCASVHGHVYTGLPFFARHTREARATLVAQVTIDPTR